jgi:hypothetical protein
MLLQKTWHAELPDGLLLKNHIVAREILLNIELWRFTEAVMHTEKKKNVLARENTTMAITSPIYTKIHVSVLGIQLHSVTFAETTVVPSTQSQSLISGVATAVTFMSMNCAVVSLIAASFMLEEIPLMIEDLHSSTLVL